MYSNDRVAHQMPKAVTTITVSFRAQQETFDLPKGSFAPLDGKVL